ncbi:hypothetical protein M899_1217 [Bacteriovorax sp. BSW11_IV]|uniref:hypothetical protein n=1 Tax=Bacteriovorax sp. BSW11_IV TaxID=1353529 RepID=UPI00038A33DB|nr:hypothetical protein [Bacteriovorax sp. BSW11_IV]EQC48559.1 hypothetical protein M899_1217 [Bacteriovorax sp. BSW11_IV]
MFLKKISDYLRGGDLKRTKHFFIIRNETSGMKVHDLEAVTPSEMNTNELILRVPAKSCQKGQKLFVNIFDAQLGKNQILKKLKANNYKGSLEIYTRVENMTEDSSGQIISLTFLEYEENKWRSFINLYKSVQTKITKLSSPISPEYELEDEDESEEGKEAS